MRKRAHKAISRQKPTPTQGRGLEILGHAIEYLLDTYVVFPSGKPSDDDLEAAQILIRANLSVFSECREIVPLSRQLAMWLMQWTRRSSTSPPPY